MLPLTDFKTLISVYQMKILLANVLLNKLSPFLLVLPYTLFPPLQIKLLNFCCHLIWNERLSRILTQSIFTNTQSLTRLVASPFERSEIISIDICIYWACIPLKTDLKPINK